MHILLDECIPRKIRRSLPGHFIKTVAEMGWAGRKNGLLLRSMASERFEVLLTVDRNLRYQQNLGEAGIAVIVLMAVSNRMEHLAPLLPSVFAALDLIGPGDVVEITG